MTDTGHVPGEGLPERPLAEAGPDPAYQPVGGPAEAAGAGFRPDPFGSGPEAAPVPDAMTRPSFTFLDQPDQLDEEDDLLLMPGPQGSWSEAALREPTPAEGTALPAHLLAGGSPADTVPLRTVTAEDAAAYTVGTPIEPSWPPLAPPDAAVQAAADAAAAMQAAPGPEQLAPEQVAAPEAAAPETVAGPFTVAAPQPQIPIPAQAAAPRRPLHAGPPIPDPSMMTGQVPVRSLADRGPSAGDTQGYGIRLAPLQQTGVPEATAAPVPQGPIVVDQPVPPVAAEPEPPVAVEPEPQREPEPQPEPEPAAPAAAPAVVVEQPAEPVPAAPVAVETPVVQPDPEPHEAPAVNVPAPTPSPENTLGQGHDGPPAAEPPAVEPQPTLIQAPAPAPHGPPSRIAAFLAVPAAPGLPDQSSPDPAPVALHPAEPAAPQAPAEQAAPAPVVEPTVPAAEAPTAAAPIPVVAEPEPVPVPVPVPEAAAVEPPAPVVVETPDAAPAPPEAPEPAAAADPAAAEEAAPEAVPADEPAPVAEPAAATEQVPVEEPAAPVPAEQPAAPEAAAQPAEQPEPVAAPAAEEAVPAAAPAAPEVPDAPGEEEPRPAVHAVAADGTVTAPEQPAPEAETAPEQPAAPEATSEPEPEVQPEAEAQPEPEPEPEEPQGPAAPGYEESMRDAVHRVMRERRDIRNGFRRDPIPHEVLIRVLEAAHTAPSVGYSQPWDFVVIRSAKTRKRMHELAERQREAYAASLPKGRAKQFKTIKIEAILETPVNIVVTADRTRGGRHTLGRHTQPQMAPYSAALAVENLWLAARAEGLGVGWVSFFDEREMVRELGLPEHLDVVAYLCIGYVDSFPDEPELQQAGWAKKRPLSWVVHEEQYGNRALPGEEPHSVLDETLRGIRPLDAKALGEAWDRQKRMTKPAGSLGMLEIISAQLCGLSRKCPPPIPEPACVAIFAGDHGVHAQGVTPWPQEVTAQMVGNFLAGGAVVNAFAAQVGAEVCVVDVGVAADLPSPVQQGRTTGLLPRKVRPGTADMTTGPAMSREEALRALEIGIETARDLVAAGNKLIITGDMGIANTTPAAALISVFTGTDPADVTGRGTGIDDETHARKVDVIRRALELHKPDPGDPVGVLAAVGGLEHAALAGLMLGAASLRTPVILDGVIAGAAALAAKAIAPEVLAACIAGHRSAEPGHKAALAKLGLRPMIDLDLRLGEGTGALLALPVVQSAARAMHDVATFDSAGVTEKR
ncbi:nicotinate-nucleotide--dimethylbenzimidazole phosphoribosyltransferase [Peterkaempfera bronchialis]|uniref:Nicotinate-nucleotide--dimethylbenzimidazole phosphoribosyltransferase n=1 Tax=Peterkaempfera bronchialis TaxID=2126346 RepID=A0A345T3W7_9ACTN|nr:nicotinate-nucleotide--dimethylbenzimidazole phosphoribosyltransferase [Peterkaempfera bronchialis]AXI80672.1 nicotinate-nucleotide--dimethylbenzimidazole phosphoribosyltransferase [Peterkaempfera bronchialis]